MSDASNIPAIADLGPRFFEFVESLERPVVFFDIEATGTDPLRDRLVELSVVRVSPLPVAIEAPRTWRVNPTVRIPSEASEVHGISNDDLRDAPTFPEIADEIIEIFKDADLAGFAITRYDIRLLQQELQRASKDLDLGKARTIDAQVIFHQREPRNLAAALQYYCDEVLEGAHGAEADTLATLKVFAGQLRRYDDLSTKVDALHEIAASLNAGFVDRGRRFVWRDHEPTFNFGKLRGKSLREVASAPNERDYLRWIMGGPFEDDVKELIREALEGKIRSNKA